MDFLVLLKLNELIMNHIYNEEQFGENWFNYPEVYTHLVEISNNEAHFVEVGSWKGKSSAYMVVEIINSRKNIKFDCIDTWESSPETINIDTSMLFETFVSNMKPLENYYTAKRGKSVDIAETYTDNSLDFCFIDACHEYEYVRADIIAWYPKVKIGGIIAGHDYGSYAPGVVKAVHELIQEPIQIQGQCWIKYK